MFFSFWGTVAGEIIVNKSLVQRYGGWLRVQWWHMFPFFFSAMSTGTGILLVQLFSIGFFCSGSVDPLGLKADLRSPGTELEFHCSNSFPLFLGATDL